MEIFDMHVHLGMSEVKSDIIEKMSEAGIYGGCVFSAPPKEYSESGKDFFERLDEVLDYTKPFHERLFPILWIHPDEERIFEKIDAAVAKGIDGFKIICNNFYVYGEKSLQVLQKIAELNKPVFFHTGILWDGGTSSQYNRPLNWEALLRIKGLRFSMGHCSWPWYDECIALYGKFLNALSTGETAEMFLDITPGTPEVYREDLLTKLFFSGYDVGSNILFGTDCHAGNYQSGWAEKWLKIDGKIMDKLGVSKTVRENLYHNNLMYFLGKKQRKQEIYSPTPDNADTWSPVEKSTAAIIEKWYRELGFSSIYDKEFYQSLNEIKISDAISLEGYDIEEKDGKRNLLSFLYFCEKTKEKYLEKGISSEILYDTLKDIVRWTDTWSNLKGTLWLSQLDWLSRHLGMRLFKLGRLQFCMGEIEEDIPSANLFKGDSVLEIHIPACGAMTPADCEESIEMAKAFFAEYYPDFDYKCFVCHSWLLDDTLKDILNSDSNIIRFRERFTVVQKEKSDAILRYVFQWNTTRINLPNALCTSKFAECVKKHVLGGNDFYESLGIMPR